MSFQNLFDRKSKAYSQYRPNYPEQMFDFFSEIAPAHDLVWDAGTGSGQAALSLAERFAKVIGTDSSVEQISNAVARPNIEYHVLPSEDIAVPGLIRQSCVDLVTAANAVHWFDIERFFEKAKLVLKPNGVIALWGNGWLSCDDALMDVIREFYAQVEDYWPLPTHLVRQEYKTISFPFKEVEAPHFQVEDNWTVERLLGYYSTWSAVNLYIQRHGKDPIEDLAESFVNLGRAGCGYLLAPDGSLDFQYRLNVNIPLYLRVGVHA